MKQHLLNPWSFTASGALRRRSYLLLVMVISLAAALALAGCGRREAAEARATPTLIATLAAPAVEPTAEPTTTPEPTLEATAETPTAEMPTDEETGEEAAAEEVTATEEVTAAEGVTATEAITGAEEITATAEVTAAEEITPTEALTGTDEVTGTGELTGPEEVTETAEITEAETLTATEALTEAEEQTGATPLLPTEELTATEEITGGEVTEAEITETEGATGAAAGAEVDGETRVFFRQPTDNAMIPITSTVVAGASGLDAADGQLYLLVDTEFVAPGETLSADELHLPLDLDEPETELVLPAGSHILRLQYAGSDQTALEGDQYRAEIRVSAVDGAPEQGVRIVTPTDGATVPPTTTVVMAAAGLTIAPSDAGAEDAGHFHLLIDEEFIAAGEMIPEDETHLDFADGALTGALSLEPGEHTLRLQFADSEHRALAGDQYRHEITVTVDEEAEDNRIMFVEPEDGATVSSPFTVTWAATGLIIEAAGQVIRPEGGHLHLLINEEFLPAGELIPTDTTHLHFGRAQTSAQLQLQAGEYTLRLQMANGAHLAQDGPQYQDEITITVE
ncbi:MAG TPA: DUF4399 domain-containing protein [Caldilineaceae bacterium]|nr:DUF4399 domain-containing protein [Caldilineaceae bacterium]